MKYREILIEQLKNQPYFTKKAIYQLSEQYGLKKTTVDTYISRSLKRKDIIPLKRGMYVSADFFDKNKDDASFSFYIANILRPPSYISSWTALQYYNLTTEIIHTTTSITNKVTRTYQTKIGSFGYQSIKDELFTDFFLVKGKFDFFIASPSKALFDLLYFKTRRFSGVNTDDIKSLILSLRIDFDEMEKDEQEKFFSLIKNMSTNNQIILMLKEKTAGLAAQGAINAETLRNVLKEELQFYVLNFIFHHPKYSNWIMYGGSALRICHGLDRMSVDLDFEVAHKIDESFLNELKKEITEYFQNTYGLDVELLTIKITTERGLRLCFNIGDLVGINVHSKQIIVKIDLNHFTAAKTTIERIPINRNQLSFVIKIYNMSSLMASKIAAILLRGQRGGFGGILYEEKGRDIYDLLWYMNKKIVPDLDYLKAKNIDITNLRELFDKLTLKINKVNNTNLKNDLSPLFVDQTFISNWLKNWLESYLRLRGEYRINTVTALKKVTVFEDMSTDNFSFTYRYETEDGKVIKIFYKISDYWMDVDLPTKIDPKIDDLIEFTSNGISNRPAPKDKLKRFIALFNEKNEGYFKKTGRIILGDAITTKFIRMTADKLNQTEQIVLDKSALLSCELEDLLK